MDSQLDAVTCKVSSHTAIEEPLAHVALKQLDTLWFNTGTLCNITCRNCYIELYSAQRSLVLHHARRNSTLPR